MQGEASHRPEIPRSAEAIGSKNVVESADAANLDRLLDEVLEDSFPASDPPSLVMPG